MTDVRKMAKKAYVCSLGSSELDLKPKAEIYW